MQSRELGYCVSLGCVCMDVIRGDYNFSKACGHLSDQKQKCPANKENVRLKILKEKKKDGHSGN